jgi:hypothetical protein
LDLFSALSPSFSFSSNIQCNKRIQGSLNIGEAKRNYRKEVKNLKKNFKRIAIASLLVIILVISVASVAMAAGPNPNPGTCPNPDCQNDGVCPNPDCPNDGVCINSDGICDGDELKYQHQNGQCQANGSGYKYQYRSCQVE